MKPVSKSSRFFCGVVCCEASTEARPDEPFGRARLNDEVGQGSETTNSGTDPDIGSGQAESERCCTDASAQEMHIRRGTVGDVAKETEAPYCTDRYCVNAMAT